MGEHQSPSRNKILWSAVSRRDEVDSNDLKENKSKRKNTQSKERKEKVEHAG